MPVTMNNYAKVGIETADRGKLIILIYDHCIRWCKKAEDAIQAHNIEERTRAIFRIQDGLTELICSLDKEKGGRIAEDLHRLYDFYNRHISDANITNDASKILEVREMMESLREAWSTCISTVRKNKDMNMRMEQRSYVSLVG